MIHDKWHVMHLSYHSYITRNKMYWNILMSYMQYIQRNTLARRVVLLIGRSHVSDHISSVKLYNNFNSSFQTSGSNSDSLLFIYPSVSLHISSLFTFIFPCSYPSPPPLLSNHISSYGSEISSSMSLNGS